MLYPILDPADRREARARNMISRKSAASLLAPKFATEWERVQTLSHLKDYIQATPEDYSMADFVQERFALRATRSEQKKKRRKIQTSKDTYLPAMLLLATSRATREEGALIVAGK